MLREFIYGIVNKNRISFLHVPMIVGKSDSDWKRIETIPNSIILFAGE